MTRLNKVLAVVYDAVLDLAGVGRLAHQKWLAGMHARIGPTYPDWDERLPVGITYESGCYYDEARGRLVCNMVCQETFSALSVRGVTAHVGGERRLLDVLLQLRRLGVPSGLVNVPPSVRPRSASGQWPSAAAETSESSDAGARSGRSRATASDRACQESKER